MFRKHHVKRMLFFLRKSDLAVSHKDVVTGRFILDLAYVQV